jgi:hypothetical protein
MGDDAGWTRFLDMVLADPDLPAAMRDPENWPDEMRAELGDDHGVTNAGRHRAIMKANFAEARAAIDDFRPDVVIMWGDDQLENFQADLIPPFAVLAYDDQEIQPWLERRNDKNPWGEPIDYRYTVRGHREAGKYLARGLIEAGFDMPYSYEPLHHPMAHAFKNTILLLDDERRGFDWPVVPFHVNCYGSRVIAARGLRLPLALRGKFDDPDPPAPTPQRCMDLGAAVARIMEASPYRTVLCASSSWSHSFLTEKNWQLWPDVAADKRLYEALAAGDYAAWRATTPAMIEESGHQETLNWFCLAGAMESLGRVPAKTEFVETWAFVSCVVFAHWPTG